LYAWCAEDPLDERIYVTFSRHEEPQKALAPVPTMSGLPLTADVETSDQFDLRPWLVGGVNSKFTSPRDSGQRACRPVVGLEPAKKSCVR
jgi:hypothetical protein